ncbi:AAA family ATPase [Lactobacillus crispatus]|uniref:AAA family ATPase n=1 Tax=Lactobacillus crispatus TaxID=47770 RepID=UPI0021A45493|nr:AAA family ATPase [Lactobacillus crispatus]
MKLCNVKIDKFRKFKNVEFKLGKRMTVVSGVNGIGKSSMISLIASVAGERKYRLNGLSFHPEFKDYFEIEKSEPFDKYRVWIDTDKKIGKNQYPLTERISFSNNTKSHRDIRPIPRVSSPINTEKWGKVTLKQVMKDSHSNSGRLPIPTVFLSLARLMPPVESDQETIGIGPNNGIKKDGYADFYIKCYNSVLYESIDYDNKESMFLNKHIGKVKEKNQRKHLFVNIKNATNRTISAGQDTLGSIIAAITDFYALKRKLGSEYTGGLLCIDEIDATLHPSAVYKLMELLKKEAEELDLQIIVTTHSLTVLNWINTQETQEKENYRLLYFVDTNMPHILENSSIDNIKADLYDQISSNLLPQITAFTEDEAGKKLLELLLKEWENSKKIRINISSLHLGGEQLIKFPKINNIFRRILIVPDGDQRTKRKIVSNNKELISDITKKYGKEKNSTSIKADPNVLFLPSEYSPEVLIYKMIEEYVEDYETHGDFWNSISVNDINYPSQRVKEYVKISPQTTYEDIHEKKNWLNYSLGFLENSNFLKDYMVKGKGKQYLNDFYTNLDKAINAVAKSNKIKLFDE